MKPRYTIERWPHGWLLCGSGGGIPADCLSECQRLFPKTAVMDAAVPHHYKVSGRPDVVVCVATPGELNAWHAAINQAIEGLPPEERWWRGLDVGQSSSSIFAVLASNPSMASAARDAWGNGATPRDADDFGRCSRLVHLFNWRSELPRVAAAYPASKWPAIIERWTDIENMPATRATAFLGQL